MPGKVDFEVVRGDTYEHEITWTEDGVAVDITNWTPLAKVRRGPDSDVLATPSVTKATDMTTGVFTVALTPVQTAALLAGEPAAIWDIQFTHVDGRVLTPAAGDVYVREDVAR
jgi:hypothetical protein